MQIRLKVKNNDAYYQIYMRKINRFKQYLTHIYKLCINNNLYQISICIFIFTQAIKGSHKNNLDIKEDIPISDIPHIMLHTLLHLP